MLPADALLRWLAAVVTLLAAAYIPIADVIMRRNDDLSTLALGLLDEPAHLFTALLLLAAFGIGYFKHYAIPVALASLLIDLDHLPGYLGSDILTRGTPRPYTHSLTTVVAVLLLAALLRSGARRTSLAVAFGLVGHLLRDLATYSVPLFWPVTNAGFHLPYPIYLAVVAVSTFVVLVRLLNRPAELVAGESGRRMAG
ncbi:MAG TPA: metal-dependent hydrolase [Chloroflexota bacterium]|nr:metal-dependent hydrolase [Chloroflexota bacterium]